MTNPSIKKSLFERMVVNADGGIANSLIIIDWETVVITNMFQISMSVVQCHVLNCLGIYS